MPARLELSLIKTHFFEFWLLRNRQSFFLLICVHSKTIFVAKCDISSVSIFFLKKNIVIVTLSGISLIINKHKYVFNHGLIAKMTRILILANEGLVYQT